MLVVEVLIDPEYEFYEKVRPQVSTEAYFSVVLTVLVNEPENGENCDRQTNYAADPYRVIGVKVSQIVPFCIIAKGEEP